MLLKPLRLGLGFDEAGGIRVLRSYVRISSSDEEDLFRLSYPELAATPLVSILLPDVDSKECTREEWLDMSQLFKLIRWLSGPLLLLGRRRSVGLFNMEVWCWMGAS